MPQQRNTPKKRLGLLFIERFADWEYGLLAAAASQWFDTDVVSLAPGGGETRAVTGFRLRPDRVADASQNGDLDALAVIGSDGWTGAEAPDVSELVRLVAERGGVVGGICGGTLALARAGLFAGRDHTSNGRDWIAGHAPSYPGAERYKDVSHAVADRRIVSAPGSAPGTFACAFLCALYPEQEARLQEMHAMFGKEYDDGS